MWSTDTSISYSRYIIHLSIMLIIFINIEKEKDYFYL